MVTRIWGATTAVIGGLILVLLVFYGTEYGTWVDEAGPLSTAPPTFILPFVIGAMAGVLLVGGTIVALVGPRAAP